MGRAPFTEILLLDILYDYLMGMGEILLSENENRRQTGARYEELAAEYLENQGLFILEKNYRCRQGEIDLIARDAEYLVFVEVKYRRGEEKGISLEAVDGRKQKRICKAARYYLACSVGNMDISCRFDVVGIDGKEEKVSWIKNAFDFCM